MGNVMLGLALHLGAELARLIGHGLDLACQAITQQPWC